MAENESTQNPAPSPAPAPAGVPQPSPAERRAAIEKSDAFLKGDHADHAAAVQAAYRLRQEEESGTRRKTAEEVDGERNPVFRDFTDADRAALPDVDTARRHAGYEAPVMPASLRETWSDEAESDFAENFVAAEGISGQVAQKIVDHYVEMMTVGGRSETGIREGDVEAWLIFLTDECRLTKAQATRLVQWHQQNSEHAAAAAAAAEAVEDLLHQRRAQS